ncbi:MAG: polysulfide reductase NrfD [Chloroflexi bacterium]|nr:polysulfide reductase NrfD [Chloroflexota bacterium]
MSIPAINPGHMAEFTFQTEWVDRRGFFLVLAFFLGGLGGGSYLVSSYLNSYQGLVAGFLLVAVGKSAAHLIYLGRPLRFWRAFLRPQNSWISRGMIAVAAFLLFSAMQILPTLPFARGLPWSFDNPVLQGLATASAIALIAYTGFALGVIDAIPFWNTALMPVLFITYSLLGGAGMALVLLSLQGAPLAAVEGLVRWMLVIAAALLGIYLWVSYNSAPASKRSVLEMLRGRVSPYFVGGVIILGLVIPFVVSGYAFFNRLPETALLAAAVSEFAGGFCLRYSILKAGVYAPLV